MIGIYDQMRVNYAKTRSDAEIRADIEQGIKWNAFVDGGLIRVDVSDGNVILSGIVGSAAEKAEARTTAYVAGVQSLDATGLAVETWARDEQMRADKYAFVSEADIADAVRNALTEDPRVQAFNISVEAR